MNDKDQTKTKRTTKSEIKKTSSGSEQQIKSMALLTHTADYELNRSRTNAIPIPHVITEESKPNSWLFQGNDVPKIKF